MEDRCPDKGEIFVLQTFHNVLPLQGTLLKRGLNIDAVCPLCQEDIKSSDTFLFFQCSNAKRTWIIVIPIIGYQTLYFPLVLMGIDYFKYSILPLSKPCFTRPPTCFGSIWMKRNGSIFKHKIFNPLQTIIRAKRASAEWRSCKLFSSTGQDTAQSSQHKHTKYLVGRNLKRDLSNLILMDL